MDLTGAQWRAIKNCLPPAEPARGRPAISPRAILNGIFWKFRSNSSWRDIPPRYPSRQTCLRHYHFWGSTGVLVQILYHLHEDLVFRGHLSPYHAIAQGSIFVYLKKNRFGYLVDPLYLEDWRTSTALLLLQFNLFNAVNRFHADFDRGLNRDVKSFRLSFKFNKWVKFAPLTFHGITPDDLLGSDEITLYYPTHPRDLVVLTLKAPPR